MPRLAHRQAVTVFLRGELDLSRGDEIAARIRRELPVPGVVRIAVDLADVTFLDCYSLGELVRARREAAEVGVSVVVIHPDDPLVRRVLEITGVARALCPQVEPVTLRQRLTAAFMQ